MCDDRAIKLLKELVKLADDSIFDVIQESYGAYGCVFCGFSTENGSDEHLDDCMWIRIKNLVLEVVGD